MSTSRRTEAGAILAELLDVLIDAVDEDPALGARIMAVLSTGRGAEGEKLGAAPRPAQATKRANDNTARRRRRTPAVLDPVAVLTDVGEAGLREQLSCLDLERLRDVIAEYGMDQAKLAMKWKTPSRLVDLIVASAQSRSEKGDAFRMPVEAEQNR